MSRSPVRALLADEAGISLPEAMVAALLLLIGMLSTVSVLDGSRDLTTVSERKEAAVHQGQRQLERVKVLAFDDVVLKSAPGAPADAVDPRSAVSGSPPVYDWDRTTAANALEPLVVNPANVNGVDPSERWGDDGSVRYRGTVHTFVSSVATDLKRVTVAVELDGDERPRTPIILSSLVSRQAGSAS